MYMQKLVPQTPHSEAQQTGEFTAVRQHVSQLHAHWKAFYEEFSRLESPYTEEFYQHNQHFSQAVDQILTALKTPTLTLATTGTTSSGKSTLVNLLCGADIMPRMAGEMSAGIVTIKHARDGKRLLKIEKTPNAPWQCGEWKDLSDDAIRDRLTQTMDTFNKAKQERDLPSPVIELTYPIACFSHNTGLLNLSDLPSHTQFQIMDLPGKRNQDDKINGAVIQNCRRALSIVTYDMAQTDEKLRQKLIGEVLDQVKLMGGSPARMLFALNRIDVFRKDHDSERREQEAAEQTIKEIKQILHERLPEHRGVLEDLSYSKLSSLPALLAWQMHCNQDEQRINAAENLDKNFGNLIEESIREELPRKTAKWESNEFDKVGESIWKNSYAENFFPVLENHIRKHFAKLIVAPLLVEFEGVVARILDQINNTCKIEIDSSREGLTTLKAQLKQDEENIKGMLGDYHEDLMSLPGFIKENPENLDLLYHASEQLGDLYKHDYIKENILPAFSKSVIEPIQWVSGVVEGVTQSLKSNTVNYADTTADELPHKQRRKLNSICRSLLDEVYNDHVYNDVDSYQVRGDSSCYGHGYYARAVDYDEKVKIRQIQALFANKIDDLFLLIQEVYEKRVTQEVGRIKYLIEEILKIFIDGLNRGIKDKGFTLTVRFDESIYRYVELEIDPIDDFNPSVDVETRSEENPWLLWLSDRDVDYLEIPAADDLHETIIEHLDRLKTIAARPLQEAIEKYYDEVNSKMKNYIDSIMDDVNAKLTTKLNNGQAIQQEEELKWQKLSSSANIINEQMQQLHNYKA